MSKTRNERRRERTESLFYGAALIAVCLLVITLLCGMACKAWCEHPAEQPISYEEYMERFGGVSYAVQN